MKSFIVFINGKGSIHGDYVNFCLIDKLTDFRDFLPFGAALRKI